MHAASILKQQAQRALVQKLKSAAAARAERKQRADGFDEQSAAAAASKPAKDYPLLYDMRRAYRNADDVAKWLQEGECPDDAHCVLCEDTSFRSPMVQISMEALRWTSGLRLLSDDRGFNDLKLAHSHCAVPALPGYKPPSAAAASGLASRASSSAESKGAAAATAAKRLEGKDLTRMLIGAVGSLLEHTAATSALSPQERQRPRVTAQGQLTPLPVHRDVAALPLQQQQERAVGVLSHLAAAHCKECPLPLITCTVYRREPDNRVDTRAGAVTHAMRLCLAMPLAEHLCASSTHSDKSGLEQLMLAMRRLWLHCFPELFAGGCHSRWERTGAFAERLSFEFDRYARGGELDAFRYADKCAGDPIVPQSELIGYLADAEDYCGEDPGSDDDYRERVHAYEQAVRISELRPPLRRFVVENHTLGSEGHWDCRDVVCLCCIATAMGATPARVLPATLRRLVCDYVGDFRLLGPDEGERVYRGSVSTMFQPLFSREEEEKRWQARLLDARPVLNLRRTEFLDDNSVPLWATGRDTDRVLGRVFVAIVERWMKLHGKWFKDAGDLSPVELSPTSDLWKLLRPRGVQLLQRNRVAESENSEEEEDLDNDPIGEDRFVVTGVLYSAQPPPPLTAAEKSKDRFRSPADLARERRENAAHERRYRAENGIPFSDDEADENEDGYEAESEAAFADAEREHRREMEAEAAADEGDSDGESELLAAVAGLPRALPPLDLSKQLVPICSYWLQGRCRFDDACWNRHSLDRPVASALPTAAGAGSGGSSGGGSGSSSGSGSGGGAGSASGGAGAGSAIRDRLSTGSTSSASSEDSVVVLVDAASALRHATRQSSSGGDRRGIKRPRSDSPSSLDANKRARTER